jgi:hypothetical protein
MKLRTLAFIAAAVLLSAMGCGGGGGAGSPKGGQPGSVLPPAGSTGPQDTSRSVVPDTTPQGFALRLIPENPDVLTGIRASLSMPGGREKVTMERVHWYINGSEVALENPQLPGTSYRRGDVVSARAEVRRQEGEFILSAPAVTVQNALPEAVSADFSTLVPVAGDIVRVYTSGRDPDGDGVTFRYHWYANDKLVEGEPGDSFRVRKGMKGMWIQAEVQAFDGIAEGSRLRTPKVRVLNAPPVVDQVEIGGDGTKFTAIVRASDPDGDSLVILAKSLPPGAALIGNTLNWDAAAVLPGTEMPVVLRISDGDGGEIEYSFRLSSAQK